MQTLNEIFEKVGRFPFTIKWYPDLRELHPKNLELGAYKGMKITFIKYDEKLSSYIPKEEYAFDYNSPLVIGHIRNGWADANQYELINKRFIKQIPLP